MKNPRELPHSTSNGQMNNLLPAVPSVHQSLNVLLLQKLLLLLDAYRPLIVMESMSDAKLLLLPQRQEKDCMTNKLLTQR